MTGGEDVGGLSPVQGSQGGDMSCTVPPSGERTQGRFKVVSLPHTVGSRGVVPLKKVLFHGGVGDMEEGVVVILR